MNKALLEYEMKRKGFTVAMLCQKIGISVSAFYKKCNGKSEFKRSEISKIVDTLQLESPNDIFFAA